MNRTYRIVFNRCLNTWVAVAETARSCSKGGRDKAVALAMIALAAVLSAPTFNAHALPADGSVSAGGGSIGTAGNTMTITQTSQNLAINWRSFNIAASETVNVVQPNSSAIVLNRVLGSDPSAIYGKLNANGQVFLVNPNGILFGSSAQVNVGGLVATTLGVPDAEFMAGRYRFAGSAGSVKNQGTITAADSGYVALLGGQVSNQGTLVAKLGNVTLAAGSDMTLDFVGDGLIRVMVNHGALDALAENKQLIRADGGRVLLTAKAADSLIAALVNNEGVIEARTVQNRGGVIALMGDMGHGRVKVDGTLDASAPDGGDGGFIETSAAKVGVGETARVTTKAAHGDTGTWLIDPNDFTIAASGGDITGAMLSSQLDSNHVTLQSTGGATAGNGDIFVNDAVSWSAHTLTLQAQRNIAINANLNASGTAGLALEYGQGNVNAGNTARYVIGNGAKVNLAATGSFRTKLGSNGATVNYLIIDSLGAEGSTTGTDLQGIQGRSSWSNYVLGADIDATATGAWTGGFAPLFDGWTDTFNGTFDGLGHVVTQLTIDRPTSDYVGLFGFIGGFGVVRNVGVASGTITGGNFVGAMAGWNSGIVDSSHAGADVAGNFGAGGLAGGNDGTIRNSHATGNLTNAGATDVGGLVGLLQDGTVSGSYATGSVLGNGRSGGLVGETTSAASIENSYATGAVTDPNQITGGLVGQNAGRIAGSFATGRVQGGYDAGGLVGLNYGGSIANSYATGQVSGNDEVGGLAGANFDGGTIDRSYAEGRVTSSGSTKGGLVGASTLWGLPVGTVTNSFWNKTTSTQNSSAGGTGKTTAQMMQAATFSAWDISGTGGSTAVWRIYEGQTAPLLRGFLSPLTVTAASGSRVYDGTKDGLGLTYSAAYDVSKISGSSNGTVSSKNVGTGYAVASGLHSRQLGYDITDVAGTLDITVRTLNVAFTGTNKIYNGTTAATVTPSDDRVSGDSLTINRSAAFLDKDAGTGKTVTITGVSLSGTDATNYLLAAANGTTTANITPKALTESGLSVAASKVYDGTTAATALGTATLLAAEAAGTGTTADGKRYSGDDVSLTGTATATYNSKDVATATSVTFGGLSLTGAQAGNYTLTMQGNAAATITRKALAVSGLSVAASKVYDATTGATALGTATLLAAEAAGTGTTTDGKRYTGDTVSLTGTATATYNNKNVASATMVTFGGLSLTGAQAGNYTLTTATQAATITRKALTVSGLSAAASKVYDATTGATVLGTATLLAAEAAGTGTQAGNYSLAPATQAATIAAKTLTITGSSVADKIYDATTTATITAGTLSGFVGTETVVIGTSSGTFADKNAGSGKSVTVTGLTLSGTDAANYTLLPQSGLTADIAKKDLAVTGMSASNKTYDATTTATLTGTAAISAISGDTVSLDGSASGTFADKNAGSGKSVTVTGLTLSGTDAVNYTLLPQSGLTADITKKDLAVTGLSASNKTYDATTTATLTGTAAISAIGGDTVSLDGSASGTFADKNAGSGKSVTVTGLTLSGTDAANYTLLQQSGLTADITRKALIITGSSVADKIYDATTAATVTAGTLSGFVGTETVSVSSSSGNFDTKDVGTNKTVTVRHALGDGTHGGLSANYLLADERLVASITAVPEASRNSAYPAALVAVQLLATSFAPTVPTDKSGGSTSSPDRTNEGDSNGNEVAGVASSSPRPSAGFLSPGIVKVVSGGMRLPDGMNDE